MNAITATHDAQQTKEILNTIGYFCNLPKDGEMFNVPIAQAPQAFHERIKGRKTCNLVKRGQKYVFTFR